METVGSVMIRIKEKIYKYLKKGSSGQSTLEFVLLIPFLIIIVLTVSQLGYMVFQKNLLEQASREGVRMLATTNSNQESYQSINRVCAGLDTRDLEINIVPANRNERPIGELASVELVYRSRGIFILIEKILGKKIFISARSSMRIESY